MTTEAPTRGARVTFGPASPIAIVAAASILAAGALHLAVTPMHFDEAKAHGIFMAVLGVWQILVAVWFFRRPTLGAAVVALLTTIASLVVWLFVTFVRAPYGDG